MVRSSFDTFLGTVKKTLLDDLSSLLKASVQLF